MTRLFDTSTQEGTGLVQERTGQFIQLNPVSIRFCPACLRMYMSMICDICGKHKSVGRSQKHKRGVAGKRWRKAVTATPRLFKPNLQKKTVVVNGEKQNMKLCTKCIKRIKKYKSIKSFKNISVI